MATKGEQPATGKTIFKRQELYKDRWTSYGANPNILGISERLAAAELKKYEIFQDYKDEFLEKISQDISVVKWKAGSILFEEGTYLDLAFYVIQGTVEVHLKKAEEQSQLSRPIFDVPRTLMADDGESAKPPNRESAGLSILQSQLQKQEKSGSRSIFLSSMDFDFVGLTSMELGPGEIFGEIGAMSGWPQSVTARTTTECELLQIRVGALRLMKRSSKKFKERADKTYRVRSLPVQLKTTPLLKQCDDAFLEALTKTVELISREPGEVVTTEGEPADALYLVRSGFLKLSQRLGEGEIVVTYLSKGMTLGEVELLMEGTPGWYYTATSVEYAELVKISRDDFYMLVNRYPAIERQLWKTAIAQIKEVGANKRDVSRGEFMQAALEKGLMQGTSILVIDMETCTRCDDCVRACADTHDGRPRFVREGDRYENLLITKACYHCQDPVCLVGCPTGAIRRAKVGDVVEIADNLCIGCQACARNCPYDAIVMHETGEVWPDDAVPEKLRGDPRLLASKCDLCYDKGHDPACVMNCPHGCAMRIGSLEQFQDLLAKRA